MDFSQPGFYPFQSYSEAVDFLFGLQRFGIKLGLKNMHRMLKAFGNPHRNLKVIHITGSNGKGSVAAFVAKILQKSGYRVGLYTSPHLLDFSERIRINGEPIPFSEVVNLTCLIRTTQFQVEEEDGTKGDPTSVTSMTFFEFTTLIALLYFVKNKVDFAVVEVGMGGRLDATNVLTPLVAVITNVSKEHTQYLGKSLMEIAEEKAGIIKPNTFLITGVTQPKILAKFRSHCQKRRCIMYCFGKKIKIKTEDFGGFNYQGIFSSYTDLKIGVNGKYQVVNAALALGVTEVLRKQGFQISEEAIREGLREMKWPGRLELICQKPRVLLDGAHNPAGIKRLVDELKNGFTYKRLFLVIGIMQDKAIKSILNQIIPLGDYVIFTQPKIDRAASPFLLFKAIEHFNKKAEVITEVSAAVKKAMSLADKEGDLVCVTGSLFVVGEARKIFYSQVEV